MTMIMMAGADNNDGGCDEDHDNCDKIMVLIIMMIDLRYFSHKLNI